MIKKILFAFFFGLITINSYALNIHVVGEWASKVLAKFIPNEETRSGVVDVYNEELEKNKGTLSAESVVKISDAAGWENFKEKRKEFVQALLVVGKAGAEYRARYGYEVCGDEKGKSGGIERCVDDVFDGLFRGINITQLQAEGLCKEYALVKYNDDIECDSQYRTEGNDDYIRCTSKTNSIDNSKESIYYEFKFDDIKESVDSAITEGVIKSICKIHDVKVRNTTLCMTKDENLCSKINDSMKKFGYSAKIKSAGSGPSWGYYCVVNTHPMFEKDLRTAFGINNRAFETGYQLSAYPEIRNKLCEYIEQNADTTITSCECNYNRNHLTTVSDGFDNSADVLTCYADGQPIDFVFDDLSEHNKKISSGNMEAFNCTVLGGEYQGKTCFTPDADLCNKIAEETLKQCPDCERAYFDSEKNACVLPNSEAAIQHQKNVNISLIVGGALVGAAVIAVTGGTGATVVALAIETVGAGIEIGAQVHIDGIADEFFMKANNCNNAKCAEEILQEYFQYLSRMVGDLKDGEKIGVDAKMATLVSMVPDDSQFLIDVVAGCYEKTDDNFDISKCDDGNWNGAQIIRAIGIGMQFASVVGSATKAILTKTGMIEKMASKTPKLTTALSKKIPGVKARITQKLAKGEKVLTSNKKAVNLSKKSDKAVSKTDDAAKGITKTVDEINVISDTKLANVASTEDQKNFDRVLKKVKDQANGNVKNKELTVENVKDGVIKKGNYTEAQMTERLNNYDEYERTHRISTQDRYKTVKTSEIGKDGKPVMKYTAERQKVHDAIIEQILDKIDDPFPATGEKPTFVMLGGRGGSGKSALNGRAYNSKNALVVDPDAIKEMLPEYKNLVQEHSKYAGLNAWEVHEESSDIAARLLEIGRERGMNVVLDATMSNAVSAEKKIIPFKQAGYRIEGAFMHTPPYEAAVNAINRGLKADGRFVPPEILLKNITNEDNFQKITPLFDNWKMYGNNFSEGGSDVFVISSSK